ncbi:ATP-binding protein [Pseudonocardia hispaniensis]|uniref:histidine kinase n=1 Tax=Pseudonocardia hispaniensis TaxID=904933 RepID=A0ABW1J649_9PSEU
MRRRIVRLTVLAAVLAVGLFGIPLAAVVMKNLFDDQRAELERVADVAALTVAFDLAHDRPPAALAGPPRGVLLALYDPHGRLVLGDGPPAASLAVRDAADSGTAATADDAADLAVAVPVRGDSQGTWAVRAAIPRAQVLSRALAIWTVMAGLGVLVLGLVWAVSRRLAARLARPLEDLAAAAGRLGEGDFSVRTAPSGVAEIDAAAGALTRTAQRLGDLLARERAFSSDASHQLRTPLSGLRLSLEAALDAPQEDQRTAIVAGISAADRLEQTVDDLLALARDTDPARGPLDLDGLLAEIRDQWSGPLADAGRTLSLDRDLGAPDSPVSTAALRQALTVLVDNAVRHGAGRVRVAVRDAGGALALDVADEGSGVSAPESELFARRSATATGHGIGLALARSLVEAEGGRLVLTRRAPPVFTLLVPAARN